MFQPNAKQNRDFAEALLLTPNARLRGPTAVWRRGRR